MKQAVALVRTAKNSPSIYFLLFTISGFTGLIYESIWSHYLKLFLGHAAYAQVLVLSIFMGGMALGAYLSTRFVHRWRNLLVAYAAVECLIGFFGMLFDPVFRMLLTVSYDAVIPYLGTPFFITTYKWIVATLVIFPQSVLLGTTFPLMSNGVIRRFPKTPGRTLGVLYFTNSIGAAGGVLFGGFYLIGAVGLPGTIMTAGIVNIFLAIIVYRIAKGYTEAPYAATSPIRGFYGRGPRLIIIAAFITGMASFIYEIAWIRMLSMVLGASTHAFELMLSAFITGLAFGSLWIRRRLDRLSNPIKTAGLIQIIMGLFALATLPLYGQSFEWMRFLLAGLDLNDAGYHLFTAASHAICLVIMLPTTFCAGMTLPLFTYILLKRGYGEKSIGQIYASNTLGSIAGVILTILLTMPLLGLKLAILIGCALDIVLGFYLLTRSGVIGKQALTASGALASVFIVGLVWFFELDTLRMNSNVFRTGMLPDPAQNEVVFHKDSKTSSIGVLQWDDGTHTILTNGKTDASIIMDDSGQISPDEVTTVLLGALAVAAKPDAKLVANIGIGSGLTTHTVLVWPTIAQVDTIEIEAAVVEGAQYFRPRVENTFSDPRSVIHIEDAKTYFSAHQKKYDIIISEPSNPWVSGTASLFTDEFYGYVKRYLNDDGVFVQWLQMYETNPQLLLSVLAALKKNFIDISMYAVADSDLIFIAGKEKLAQYITPSLFDHETVKQELRRIGVHGLADLNSRFIANSDLLAPLIDRFSPTINSDYFPYLDLNAVRARFKKQGIVDDILSIRFHVVPVADMLFPETGYQDLNGVSGQFDFYRINIASHKAQALLRFIRHGEDMPDNNDKLFNTFKTMTAFARSCGIKQADVLWNKHLQILATLTIPYLPSASLDVIWASIMPDCNNGLNVDQRRWLDLMKALGRRDGESVSRLATHLLAEQDRWDIEQRRIQFTAQFTALMQLEDYHAAKSLWEQYINALYRNQSLPLLLLILYSLMDQNVA